MSADELTVQACRAAVLELGHKAAPLTRLQAIVTALMAIHAALLKLDRTAPIDVQQEVLVQAARDALAEARHWAGSANRRALSRSQLVGGIESLPEQQQLVMSLRFEHDLNDREIAAVLGIPEHDVVHLTAIAFDELLRSFS